MLCKHNSLGLKANVVQFGLLCVGVADEDWDTWGGEDEDKDEGVHADDPDFNVGVDINAKL